MDTAARAAVLDEICNFVDVSTRDVSPVAEEPAREEILEQLDRVTESSHFRNSKRYPALLRFIVEEALAGRKTAIKERTIGICVFGRSADYDTNADPVVRISAGEVRKRIAQYYQTPGHERELRIEMPLGSYVPRFYRPDAGQRPAAPERDVRPIQADAAIVATTPACERTEQFQVPPESRSEDEHAAEEPCEPGSPLRDLGHLEPVSSSNAVSGKASARSMRGGSTHIAVVYGFLLATLLCWGLLEWHRSQQSALPEGAAMFWRKMTQSPEPTLIVLGVHSFDAQGADISALSHASLPQPQQTLLSAMTRSDLVHLSDLTSYSEIVTFLTRHSQAFRTRGAADTTLEELRQGPFVLIGGFNNVWTKRLSQQLRYRFVTLNGTVNVIQDSAHPDTVWSLDASQNALANSRDYAIVSCFLDPQTTQYVMLVGGIGSNGTQAAAAFVTSERGLKAWSKTADGGRAGNIELVLATDVVEGKYGAPKVVASYRW